MLKHTIMFAAVAGLVFALAPAAQAGTLSYQTAVLGDSPLVYLPFDETTGTTAANIGSLGASYGGSISADGVTLGQATFTNGATAFGFTGARPGDVVLGSALPSAMTEWTIEHWVNWNTKNSKAGACGQNRPGSADDVYTGLGISAIPAGNFGVYLAAASGTDQADVPMSANVWHHAVATGSGSAGELKLYIDGVLVATDDDLASTCTFANGANIAIGDISSVQNYDFVGLIDEFAIYDTVLDVATVKAHYDAGVFVIPEPATAVLLALGLPFVMRRRRRS